MTYLSKIRTSLQWTIGLLVVLGICLIPLVWSRQVNANYVTTKSTLLFFTGGLCFLYLALSSLKTQWNRTTHILGLFGVAMVAWHVAYAFIFNYPISLFLLPKLFALVGIFVFLVIKDFQWDIFYKKYEWLYLVVFSAVIGLAFHSLIISSSELGYYERSHFMAPFGNVNMMAEFYLLTIPFHYYWVKNKFKVPTWAKWTIFILANLVIIIANSRSTHMGLCLWWMWYFYKVIDGHKKYIFIILTPFFFIGTIKVHTLVSMEISVDKTKSNSERSNFYLATKDMIIANPLGIGLKFSNEVVPYRLSYPAGPLETEYPDQPHSEILKWGAQFGWPGLVVCLTLLLWITYIVFLKSRSFFLQGALLALSPQVLFQFPFENPATIMVLAFLLYGFYQVLPSKKTSIHISMNIAGLVLSVFLVWQAWAYWTAVYKTSQYPSSLSETTKACEANPAYLPGCIMKNYNIIQSKDFVKAKENFIKDSSDNYYHVDFLKILISYLFETGKVLPPPQQEVQFRKLCEALHIYAIIFKDQKNYSAQDTRNCLQVPKPFEFNNPQQFSTDFKAWFSRVLQ